MKVILSKKGLDSSNCTSPITVIEGEELVFIPIPTCEKQNNLKYNDENYYRQQDRRLSLIDVMKTYLKDKEKSKLILKIPIQDELEKTSQKDIYCHLDPQLKNYFGVNGFRGNFGPGKRWQSILHEAEVGVGDIFLFFGWYWNEDLEQEQNIIFGYMQVGTIVHFNDVNNCKLTTQGQTQPKTIEEIKNEFPFLENNPHWQEEGATIYIAKEICDFGTNIQGWGIFKYSKELVLTDTIENNPVTDANENNPVLTDTNKNDKGKLPSKTHWYIPKFNDIKEIKFANNSAVLENGKGRIVKGYA